MKLSSRIFTFVQGSFLKSMSHFFPDPALVRKDGDVSLFFLSGNGVHFSTFSEDDWYRATVPDGVTGKAALEERPSKYRPEEAASPLGCVEQHQWCRDPTLGECGNLEGTMDSIYSAARWFNLSNEDLEPTRPIVQSKAGSILIWAYFTLANTANLMGIVDTLGPTSLASQIFVQTGFVNKVENNQWQLDVTRWVYTWR